MEQWRFARQAADGRSVEAAERGAATAGVGIANVADARRIGAAAVGAGHGPELVVVVLVLVCKLGRPHAGGSGRINSGRRGAQLVVRGAARRMAGRCRIWRRRRAAAAAAGQVGLLVVREGGLEVAQAAGKVVASAAGRRWHLVPRREFDNIQWQPNALYICKSFACLLLIAYCPLSHRSDNGCAPMLTR